MAQPIDTLAAQAVFAAAQGMRTAHLLECAVHDSGPWTMTYNGITVPVSKVIYGEGVMFSATFPEVCWVQTPEDTTAYLYCREEVMGFRQIEHPGDCAFAVCWSMDLVTDDFASLSSN